MRNFNKDHFLNNLCQQLNENLTQDGGDPNAYFSNFCNLFSKTIAKHATRRPITRGEQLSKRKPRITNGFNIYQNESFVRSILSNSKHLKVTMNTSDTEIF